MILSLDMLKNLSLRLVTERKDLIEALAKAPSTDTLSDALLRRLADVSAAANAVSREVAACEPHLGWGENDQA